MAVYRLDERIVFPDPEMADDSGLLAVGGDLSPKRLLLAYSIGIFPWYHEGMPILWHSPDPRLVLPLDEFHLPRSLAKRMRKQPYEITVDTAFAEVIAACSELERPGQSGTWITDEMIGAYVELHELGFAHSVEAWSGGSLVGGLYGISLGSAFFGESMFARASDASKIAFAELVAKLRDWDFDLIDCQVHTDHLERFGATEWSRSDFLEALSQSLDKPTRRGRWTMDGDEDGAPQQ